MVTAVITLINVNNEYSVFLLLTYHEKQSYHYLILFVIIIQEILEEVMHWPKSISRLLLLF